MKFLTRKLVTPADLNPRGTTNWVDSNEVHIRNKF